MRDSAVTFRLPAAVVLFGRLGEDFGDERRIRQSVEMCVDVLRSLTPDDQVWIRVVPLRVRRDAKIGVVDDAGPSSN